MKKVFSGLKIYSLFFVFMLVFTFIFSFLVYNGSLRSNNTSIDNYTIIIAVISYIFLGMLAGNHHQHRGLFFGTLYSGIILIIFLLLSFLGFEDINKKWIIKLIILLFAGGFGGFLGVNVKKII